VPPPIPPPPPGWENPSAPPANPAPLVFPPGSGVRFTIGRTRDCDLCLSDLSVSRMHALLVRREDGWVLSDLGSHNGTRLNGWLVREPVQVRAGDRVEFGSMAFIMGDPPAPSLPAGEEEPGLAGTEA
jgi:pSer/pThr/pTyr-binding forkhead associated (FHA) protein